MASVYFLQDLYFSQKVFLAKPQTHLDVGSRIDGFVAQIAVFMEVDVMDIRPNNSPIPNINFVEGDITKPPKKHNKLYDSISSLHVVEHIGLGRYGDTIDPEGHRRAIEGLRGRLNVGGMLYISVPVGRPRIEFNAHRVFDAASFDKLLGHNFLLVDYALIDDDGHLHSCSPRDETKHKDLHFGCGLWTVRRIQ